MLIGQLGKLIGNIHQDTDQELGTIENLDPSLFSAKVNSEDTPSYEETMHGPLAGEFRKALDVGCNMLDLVRIA
jgi:hypothetical protein